MPRSGKRPGAGAPKGNLNALKHGRRSAQFATLGALLASNPKMRDTLLGLAHRSLGSKGRSGGRHFLTGFFSFAYGSRGSRPVD